ncbi:protein containing DUF4112 [Rhodopirellula islandica]|uniref:Protein containing DUF4112 n=1 Tax=Rhodopirellula islandica TaxID=595434 RepID=A0A0J1B4F9_RHOIS|nr:DUF4112 domain-containing protein [Rhodopirellula islandica]KLU01488.1 protein containing DUF4112 [Rhodopirellula islandica]
MKSASQSLTGESAVLTEVQLSHPSLRWVDRYSRLLDTRFRIPGTKVRFGLDFLLGLVPGAGDAISMGLSGILIATMAKNGASPRLVLRMLTNVGLDALVGTIPILGNLFDLFYKANHRNLLLLREYYVEDKHRRSIWPILMAIVITLIILLGLMVMIFVWCINAIMSLFQASGQE